MMTGVVGAAKHNDSLGQMVKHMGWEKHALSSYEILELEKYVIILGPVEKLFTSLNGEKVATIHLVFPGLKVHQSSVSYFILLISKLSRS